MSDKGLLSHLQTVVYLLYLLTWGKENKRALWDLFYKEANSIHAGSNLKIQSPSKAQSASLISWHCRIGFQHIDFGRSQSFQSIAEHWHAVFWHASEKRRHHLSCKGQGSIWWVLREEFPSKGSNIHRQHLAGGRMMNLNKWKLANVAEFRVRGYVLQRRLVSNWGYIVKDLVGHAKEFCLYPKKIDMNVGELNMRNSKSLVEAKSSRKQ